MRHICIFIILAIIFFVCKETGAYYWEPCNHDQYGDPNDMYKVNLKKGEEMSLDDCKAYCVNDFECRLVTYLKNDTCRLIYYPWNGTIAVNLAKSTSCQLVRLCPNIPLENGRVVGGSPPYIYKGVNKTQVSLECEDGYTFNVPAPNLTFTCFANESWVPDPSLAQCVPIPILNTGTSIAASIVVLILGILGATRLDRM